MEKFKKQKKKSMKNQLILKINNLNNNKWILKAQTQMKVNIHNKYSTVMVTLMLMKNYMILVINK